METECGIVILWDCLREKTFELLAFKIYEIKHFDEKLDINKNNFSSGCTLTRKNDNKGIYAST